MGFLYKAQIDKTKLVQVQRTVSRQGKTFLQNFWVKPSQVKSTDRVIGGQQNLLPASGSVPTPAPGAFDKAYFDTLVSDKSKALEYLKSCGITWNEHNHAGINWMRAMQAVKATSSKTAIQPTSQSQSTAQSTPSQATVTIDQSTLDELKQYKTGKEKVAFLKEKLGQDGCLQFAKQQGVKWDEHTHKGINIMRMSMALQKHLDSNGSISVPQPEQPKEKREPKEEPMTLQDLIKDVSKPKVSKPKKPKIAKDILEGITQGTKTEYEKAHFGDSISKASPENLRNYRTLGMCAGDKESEAYLADLYKKYVQAITLGNPQEDSIRQKLQGVVNKSVVDVVKKSLANIRKRVGTKVIQANILEPWVDPNASLSDGDKKDTKVAPSASAGNRRNQIQKEKDYSHSLMHRVLDKFKNSSEYGQLAEEYDDLLSQFEQLTRSNEFFQCASRGYNENNKVLKTPKDYEEFAISEIESQISKKKANLGDIQQTVADYSPGGAKDYTKETWSYAAERKKDYLEKAPKRIKELSKEIAELESLKSKVDGNKLAEANQIRKQLFDSKFTDLNANLYHYKQMAQQLSYQYEIKKDFVFDYPILSKTDIDKLETSDTDCVTQLALCAGMFKPSLTRTGKSAKDVLLDKYKERQAMLKIYGGATQVSGNPTYAEDNEVRCKVSKASPQKAQEIIKQIAANWDNQAHGNMKYKIKGVFEVSGLAVEEQFNQIKAKNQAHVNEFSGGKNCASDFFYHGTGSMATSLILGHSGQFKVGKAKVGRMLGDGIYLADKSSKSAQYLNDFKFSMHNSQGSLMVVEASLGRTVTGFRNRHKPGDSVYAGGPTDGLLNKEWCVRDPQAVMPRYLVQIELL